MNMHSLPLAICAVAILIACGGNNKATTAPVPQPPGHMADVIGVQVSGVAGAYRFNVTVASPDSGCARYADWWEVLSADGQLLYRRVLLHSHTTEQPFTRSGGAVASTEDQVVWIRAHMHPDGYGGHAMQGTVAAGFTVQPLSLDFAAAVVDEEPLPTGCAF